MTIGTHAFGSVLSNFRSDRISADGLAFDLVILNLCTARCFTVKSTFRSEGPFPLID
jgi:hypothetical protein